MACAITITSVAGIGVGPDGIAVQGIAEECVADPADGGHVIVTLACGDPAVQVASGNADVFADGVFSITFPDIAARCPCGGPVTATATCATDPDCFGSLTSDLACTDCPSFFKEGDDVDIPQFRVQCESDGTATVEVTQFVQNGTGAEVNIQIDCGPDHVGATVGNITNFGPGDSGVASGVCRYPTPGTPAPIRIVTLDAALNPTGCPPLVSQVPTLDPCPAGCGVIRSVDVVIAATCEPDPDDDTEKRRVSFTPTVDAPAPDAHFWSFGDDSSAVLGLGMPGPIDHLYLARPTLAPQLSILGPGECGQRNFAIPLTEFDGFVPCNCPANLAVAVSMQDCVSQGGVALRQVRFTPSFSGDAEPDLHLWNFGDGESDGDAGWPSEVTHPYGAAPGQSPTLTIKGPGGCDDLVLTIPLTAFDGFAPCGDGPPPEPEPSEPESIACVGLRLAGALLLAIAALLGLLAACFSALAAEFGIAAGAAAVLGAVLLILYAILCDDKPCEWYLRVTAHVLIGSGILALMFSGCCSHILVPAGIGAIIAGLGVLGTWAVRCSVSRCDFLVELTIAAGYVLPGAGLAAVIDFLTDNAILATVIGCIDGQKTAAIAGAVSVLVAGSIRCRNAIALPDNAGVARN